MAAQEALQSLTTTPSSQGMQPAHDRTAASLPATSPAFIKRVNGSVGPVGPVGHVAHGKAPSFSSTKVAAIDVGSKSNGPRKQGFAFIPSDVREREAHGRAYKAEMDQRKKKTAHREFAVMKAEETTSHAKSHTASNGYGQHRPSATPALSRRPTIQSSSSTSLPLGDRYPDLMDPCIDHDPDYLPANFQELVTSIIASNALSAAASNPFADAVTPSKPDSVVADGAVTATDDAAGADAAVETETETADAAADAAADDTIEAEESSIAAALAAPTPTSTTAAAPAPAPAALPASASESVCVACPVSKPTFDWLWLGMRAKCQNVKKIVEELEAICATYLALDTGYTLSHDQAKEKKTFPKTPILQLRIFSITPKIKARPVVAAASPHAVLTSAAPVDTYGPQSFVMSARDIQHKLDLILLKTQEDNFDNAFF